MTASHKAKLLAAYPTAKDKIFTLAEYATGTDSEIPDAYGKPMDFYEMVFAKLDTYLTQALLKATAPK